jgi:hypothetical protein
MKINYDAWCTAKAATNYHQGTCEAAMDNYTAQLYLAGIRVQNVMDYVSDYHADQLDRISAYVSGIQGKSVPKYLYYGYAYGLQIGLQVARQRIDKEINYLVDKDEEHSYIEGYKAARAAIGKYKYVLGGSYPKNRSRVPKTKLSK